MLLQVFGQNWGVPTNLSLLTAPQCNTEDELCYAHFKYATEISVCEAMKEWIKLS